MCSVGCRSPELKYPTGVIAPYYDQVCVVGWLITIVFCYVLCFIFIIYHEKYYKISNALEAFFLSYVMTLLYVRGYRWVVYTGLFWGSTKSFKKLLYVWALQSWPVKPKRSLKRRAKKRF